MPGLNSPFYPWPYIEGLALDEAANDLAFVSTGLYGKPLPPQNGGPIRLTVPWKYGFKSSKALTKISFTEKRPMNFWQAIQPAEYGFWANVNPAVAHPAVEPGAGACCWAATKWCQRRFTTAMVSSSHRFTATGKTRNCSCDCPTNFGRSGRHVSGRRRRRGDAWAARGAAGAVAVHDRSRSHGCHAQFHRHAHAAWLWDYLIVPLMVRPAWLVPAGLGLICGGVSLSLSTRKTAHRSHRRS